LLSNNDKAEPRFQVNGGPNTQLMFGVNVDDWKPGTAKTVTATAFGYPIESLKDVPAVNIMYKLYFTYMKHFTGKTGMF